MINSVVLVGRLTRDPEMQKTASGKSLCRFTLAVDDGKKANGEKLTNFPAVEAWEQPANYLCSYGHKGDIVAVNGKVRTGTYEKGGETRRTTSIVANTVNILSSSNRRAETPETRAETPEYPEEYLPF